MPPFTSEIRKCDRDIAFSESLYPPLINIQNTQATSNTQLRSNIVVETDAQTRGRGDAEKMNLLRMNATV
jgi:hypothetical protein